MGRDTPVYNEKTCQEFPLDFPFIAYLLNLNYEKSAECNSTFLSDKFFSILAKCWLWEIIHLEIWTHFSIRQTKLFWINLKHYSQSCSNDHLCKTTTHLRRPMLSPPKPFPVQSLLYKTTTCLTWPATTFLSLKWKKAV